MKWLLFEILNGVRDLRQHGVIHRDLKPDNILFQSKSKDIQKNKLKIIDLGLGTFSLSSTKLLHRKCGTPGFMAPEVIGMTDTATADTCSNSDIFSVGVIFYYMLTKKTLFSGNDIYNVMEKNQSAEIDYSSPELSKLSPSCLCILKSMLAVDPAARITPEVAL